MRAIMAAQARANQTEDMPVPRGDATDLRSWISVLQQQQRFSSNDARRGLTRGHVVDDASLSGSVKLALRVQELEDRFDLFDANFVELVRGLEEPNAFKREAVETERTVQLQGRIAILETARAPAEREVQVLHNKMTELSTAVEESRLNERLSCLEASWQKSVLKESDVTKLSQQISGLQAAHEPLASATREMQTQMCSMAASVEHIQKQLVPLVKAKPTKAKIQQRPPSIDPGPSCESRNKKGDPELDLRTTLQNDKSERATEKQDKGPKVRRQPIEITHGCTTATGQEYAPEVIMTPSASSTAVPVPTPPRDFTDRRYRFLPDRMSVSKPGFTLISMNVLAGYLGRSKSHGYCKDEHLVWPQRKQKLLDGFKRARPDVLLLQEVQGTGRPSKDHHIEMLSESLGEVGYSVGAYVRTCSENGEEEGNADSKNWRKPHIGNAVFFADDVWEKIDEGRIAFAQLLLQQCGDDAAYRERYTHGHQSAAWARLQHRSTHRRLVAVSVHISNNFAEPDTQLAQVNIMLEHLEKVVLHKDDSVVIGGDFNSLPSSGVYEFLSTGALAADHPDASPCAQRGTTDARPICGPTGFKTGLRLCSAYTTANGQEPALTTKAPSFAGAIDYIWYSKGSVDVEPNSALCTPTVEEAGIEGGGIPNSEVPSDHVPIGVAFAFGGSSSEAT